MTNDKVNGYEQQQKASEIKDKQTDSKFQLRQIPLMGTLT